MGKITSVKFLQSKNSVLYHDILVGFQATSYFLPVLVTCLVNVLSELRISCEIWSDLLHSPHGKVHLPGQILTFTLSQEPWLICCVI